MRVLIRRARTGEYWCSGHGKWERNRSQAHNFVTSRDALEFSLRQEMKNVEVILAFDDQLYDVVIPLTEP